MVLDREEIFQVFYKGVVSGLYDRHSKDLWLLTVLCPEFLNRCKIEVKEDKKEVIVSVDLNYPQSLYRNLYLKALNEKNYHPKFSILNIGSISVPKAIWETIYSLASLVFAVKKGKMAVNLLAPITIFTENYMVIKLTEVKREEAKDIVKAWFEIISEDKREKVKQVLIEEGYITEDYDPKIPFNLLYEAFMKRALGINKEYMLKICPYCGKVFLPKRKDAVFCSGRCSADFMIYVHRNKLAEAYESLKEDLISKGFFPEEALEKAVNILITNYPHLSKAKRQELGISRKRRKKQNSDSDSI